MTELLTEKEQEELASYILNLFKDKMKDPLADFPSVEERNAECDAILDDYLAKTGKAPDSLTLSIMANYILADTIKNPLSSKTKTEEYPLQSGYSKTRAYKRELPFSEELIDFLHSKHHKRLDTLTKKTTVTKEES